MSSPTDTAVPVRTGLYIGGVPRFTAEKLTVIDPGRPEIVVGEASSATEADVADAVAAAKEAFPAWSSLSAKERAAAMAYAIQDIAEDRAADASIGAHENGKPVREAWGDPLVLEMRWNLALELSDDVDSVDALLPDPVVPARTDVSHQALGVVTIIVPYNWPLAILGAALPYALLAGNTVIVKPPPSTPLAPSRVVQRIAERLPAGVLNVITGPDAHMTGLVQNTDIAKVCFTGSVGGGKRIMSMAAQSLTRVMLELGGNDAALLLEDAILDDAHLDRLHAASFATAGQVCMNAKRLYVHRSRLDEVVAGLSARLERTVLGHGHDENTTMGPLHQRSQKEFVESLIHEARQSGAQVREFGELPVGDLAEGNFVRPALVIDPDPTLRVVVEEQFGPVLPILPFDTEDEAVALANDTWGGLGASVWTASDEAADRVGSQLACGTVWVNDHGGASLDMRAPFGGMKQSGFGREQGLAGLRAFQDTRAITRSSGSAAH